jgi:hypothetical protein
MKSNWLLILAVLPSLFLAGSDSTIAADARTRKDRFTPEERSYWAFQPVANPKVPSVRDSGWVRNPIDAFILSQLEAKGLQPSSPADRALQLAHARARGSLHLSFTGARVRPETKAHRSG